MWWGVVDGGTRGRGGGGRRGRAAGWRQIPAGAYGMREERGGRASRRDSYERRKQEGRANPSAV